MYIIKDGTTLQGVLFCGTDAESESISELIIWQGERKNVLSADGAKLNEFIEH